MKGQFYADSTSMVGGNAIIGEGTKIWQFCNIMDGAVIGNNCNIGQNVFIESGVIVGNGVKIKNNIALYKGVICEDNVFLGPDCVFTNVNCPRSFIEKKDEFKETLVCEGATIGANATIVCGNKIGKYAFVAAGSVVTRDVKDYELVLGNPARQHGWVCRCGERLYNENNGLVCKKCGSKFVFSSEILKEANISF